MNKPVDTAAARRTTADGARRRWQREYREGDRRRPREVANRSGIPIKPLYTPPTGRLRRRDDALGYPGQPAYTRGIYATMHRGRTWTQRQLIGLGTPADYNARLRDMLDARRHRRLADAVQFGVSRLRHGRGRRRSCSAPAAS